MAYSCVFVLGDELLLLLRLTVLRLRLVVDLLGECRATVECRGSERRRDGDEVRAVVERVVVRAWLRGADRVVLRAVVERLVVRATGRLRAVVERVVLRAWLRGAERVVVRARLLAGEELLALVDRRAVDLACLVMAMSVATPFQVPG